MSKLEIIICIVAACIPVIALGIVVLSNKNKKKISQDKAKAKEKERVKNLSNEERELEELKKKIEFDKKYNEQRLAEMEKSEGEQSKPDRKSFVDELDELESSTRPERPQRPTRQMGRGMNRPNFDRRPSRISFDDELFDDVENEDSIADEIKNMSPKMRAVMFADLLKKKD